jgi:Ca2+-binding EF-hand superfamily protein
VILNYSDLVEIKRAFQVFDIEGEGQIRMDELEAALRIARTNPTPKDIENIKNGLGNPGTYIQQTVQKPIVIESLFIVINVSLSI